MLYRNNSNLAHTNQRAHAIWHRGRRCLALCKRLPPLSQPMPYHFYNMLGVALAARRSLSAWGGGAKSSSFGRMSILRCCLR